MPTSAIATITSFAEKYRGKYPIAMLDVVISVFNQCFGLRRFDIFWHKRSGSGLAGALPIDKKPAGFLFSVDGSV